MSQEPMAKIRVLVAPNSMKGSLGASLFADAIGEGLSLISDRFEIRKLPVADGGDDTAEVLLKALGLRNKTIQLNDPLGRLISAPYGLRNDVAVIEMANCSGMKLLREYELNPMQASSYGFGQALLDAVKNGAKEVLLGLGGSATVDGGMGLLEALGVRFFNADGDLLEASGVNVGKIRKWDDSAISRFEGVKIRLICDVDNPLLGKNGAVSVFAPQKGATEAMMPLLEANLRHFEELIFQQKKKRLKDLKGMGAAGGISLALVGFLNASIVSGADFVLDQLGFDKLLAETDVVITGEGKIDEQSGYNKAPFVVALRAKQKQIPVVAIGGLVTETGAKLFNKAFSLTDEHVSEEMAILNAEYHVCEKAKQLAGWILKEYGND